MTDLTEATRTCRTCGEEIKPLARKCIHCGSYQDFRSYLSAAIITVLSLIVALVSLVITATPLISKAVKGESSNFSFSIQSPTDKAIPIFISNSGTRPGTVWRVELTLARQDSVRWEEHELKVVGEQVQWPLLVEPGTSRLFNFSYPVPHDNLDIQYKYNGQCSLVMFVTDFSGTDGAIRQRFQCNLITSFLAARDTELQHRVLSGNGPIIGPPVRVIPLVRDQKYLERK